MRMYYKDKLKMYEKITAHLDTKVYNKYLQTLTDSQLVNLHDEITRKINNKRIPLIIKHLKGLFQKQLRQINRLMKKRDLQPHHYFYKGVQSKFKYSGIGQGATIDLSVSR